MMKLIISPIVLAVVTVLAVSLMPSSPLVAKVQAQGSAATPSIVSQTAPNSDSSCSPGSLTVILPFATQNHVTVFELFAQDLFTAYNPNWTLHATYGTAYAAAIANAAAGTPAATSQTQGNVVIQGVATQQ
jgi:hypothetical protein